MRFRSVRRSLARLCALLAGAAAVGCAGGDSLFLSRDAAAPGDVVRIRVPDAGFSAGDPPAVDFGDRAALFARVLGPDAIEALAPAAPVGERELTVRLGGDVVGRADFRMLPAPARRLLLRWEEGAGVTLIGASPTAGGYTEGVARQGRRLSYDVLSGGSLAFTGSVVHPLADGHEVFFDPERGGVNRVPAPGRSAVFSLKIADLPESVVRFYDAPPAADLTTDQGRAECRLLSELKVPDRFSAAAATRNVEAGVVTPVHVSGPTQVRYDLVVLGDGFTAEDQELFNAKVKRLVEKLETEPRYEPFGEFLSCINVWRVNVLSNESGIDVPTEGIVRDTALDCRYGDPEENSNETERSIRSDSPEKVFAAADAAPDYDSVVVLVNSELPGGSYVPSSGLSFAYAGREGAAGLPVPATFANAVVHELGHRIAGLADEYLCDVILCSPAEGEVYTGLEPKEPNVTTHTQREKIPWKDLILPGTPLPTEGHDVPDGTVGLWEGAKAHMFGIFRPEPRCMMKGASFGPFPAFCAVCRRELEKRLLPYCCPEVPSPVYCLDAPLMPVEWDDWRRTKLRFALPPCLTCPPFQLLDEMVLDVAVEPFVNFDLQIVDDDGEVVIKAGRVTEGWGQVLFQTHRSKQYFAEVLLHGDEGGALKLTPALTRNGVPEELPTESLKVRL